MNDCTRARRTRDQMTLHGRMVSDDERRFVEAHLAGCLACRAEATAVDALSSAEPGFPAPALDDLATRRWIDAVVDDDHARAPGRLESAVRRTSMLQLGALAAVLAVGTVGLLLAVSSSGDRILRGTESVGVPPVAEGAAAKPEPAASFLMISGERLSSIRSAGERIEVGDRVRTGPGAAVVGILGLGRVMLREDTDLEIVASSTAGVELSLREGEILAEWTPGAGADLVITAGGERIAVKGTVFSVDADRRRVRVLRGEVEVVGADGRSAAVGSGEAFTGGSAGVVQMPDEEIAVLREDLTALRAFAAGEAARLIVISEPAGAVVGVDGVVLGTTPLEALMNPGSVELSVAALERPPIVEALTVAPGEDVSRRYVFQEPATQDGARRKGAGEPTAEILLRRAQEHRIERRWGESARTLEELIRRYPDEPESTAALVSLSLIQLDHLGSPARALGNLDRYMARPGAGPLYQEAAYARVRALRALGRRDEERAAASELLARFPDSIQAPDLRARLGEPDDEP